MTKSEVVKSIAAIHDKADQAIKEIIELQEEIRIRKEMIMDAVSELEFLNEDIEDEGVQDTQEG